MSLLCAGRGTAHCCLGRKMAHIREGPQVLGLDQALGFSFSDKRVMSNIK